MSESKKKGSPVKEPQENPWSLGAEPEEIIGLSCITGSVCFLVKFKGYSKKHADIVTCTQLRYKYPDMVIQYFQERVRFVDINKSGDPVVRIPKCPLVNRPQPKEKESKHTAKDLKDRSEPVEKKKKVEEVKVEPKKMSIQEKLGFDCSSDSE